MIKLQIFLFCQQIEWTEGPIKEKNRRVGLYELPTAISQKKTATTESENDKNAAKKQNRGNLLMVKE